MLIKPIAHSKREERIMSVALRLQDIADGLDVRHPTIEELSTMEKEELINFVVKIEIRMSREAQVFDAKMFQVGVVERQSSSETSETRSWKAYRKVIQIKRRNEFKPEDNVIMRALVHLTIPSPERFVRESHLFAMIEGYLSQDGISKAQIKTMLDNFLYPVVATYPRNVMGIKFWFQS